MSSFVRQWFMYINDIHWRASMKEMWATEGNCIAPDLRTPLFGKYLVKGTDNPSKQYCLKDYEFH